MPLIPLLRLGIQFVRLTGGINIPVIPGRMALETRGGGYHLLRLGGERSSARPKGGGEAPLRASTRCTCHGRRLGKGLAIVAVCVGRVCRNRGRTRPAKEEGGLRANGDTGRNGLRARNRGMAPYVPHGDRATYVNGESARRGKREEGDLPAVASEQVRWRIVQYTQAWRGSPSTRHRTCGDTERHSSHLFIAS